MVLLTKLAEAGPWDQRIAAGSPVKVYESVANLVGGGVFATPLAALQRHLYDGPPAVNDWIAWGDAEFVRLQVNTDQNSAANGAKLQYTIDGSTPVTLDQDSVVGATPYDSGWIPRLGVAFRLVYTNGATPQTSNHIVVEVVGTVHTTETP